MWEELVEVHKGLLPDPISVLRDLPRPLMIPRNLVRHLQAIKLVEGEEWVTWREAKAN